MPLDPEVIKKFDAKTKKAAQKIYDDGPAAVRKLRRAIDKYDSAVERMEQFYFVYDVHVQEGGYRHERLVFLNELGGRFKALIDGGGSYYSFSAWSPENTNLMGGSHGTGFMTNDQIKKLENKEDFEKWWAMATKMNHGGHQFTENPNAAYGHGGTGLYVKTDGTIAGGGYPIQAMVWGAFTNMGRKSPSPINGKFYDSRTDIYDKLDAPNVALGHRDDRTCYGCKTAGSPGFRGYGNAEKAMLEKWAQTGLGVTGAGRSRPMWRTMYETFYHGANGIFESHNYGSTGPGLLFPSNQHYNPEGTYTEHLNKNAIEMCADSLSSMLVAYRNDEDADGRGGWRGHSVPDVQFPAADSEYNFFKCKGNNRKLQKKNDAQGRPMTGGSPWLTDALLAWHGNAYAGTGNGTMNQLWEYYMNIWWAIQGILVASNEIAEMDFDYLNTMYAWADSAQAGKDLTDPYEVFKYYAEHMVRLPDFDGDGNPLPPEQTEEEALQRQKDSNQATQPTITQRIGVWQREMMYKEQCYLLSHIFPLTDHARQYGIKNLPYVTYKFSEEEKKDPRYQVTTGGNACLLVDADPYALINKLTQDPSQQILFDMQTKDISTLQPMVRLFKVEFNDKGKEIETEYVFDSYERSLSSLLSTAGKRGTGVGLKKFSFTYDGHDPFAAKKSIKARLEIFANSFDELLKERDRGKTTLGGSRSRVGSKFKYVELALKTANTKNRTTDSDDVSECKPTKTQANDNLSKLNFRLKAVVGWAFPPGKTNHMSPGAKDAVYDSFVTLNLTPTVHDFKFDELGRVTLTINYLAFVEDFFDQPEFSIFADVNILAKQELRKLSYNYHSSKCNSEQLNDIKQAHMDRVNIEKRVNVQSIMSRLLTEDKIRYIDVPYQDIRGFVRRGPFYRPSEALKIKDSKAHIDTLKANIDAAIEKFDPANDKDNEEFLTSLGQGWADEGVKEKFKAAVGAVGPNSAGLAYFYVRDLVDVVLRNVEEVLEKLPKAMDSLHASGDLSTEPPEQYKLNKCDLVLRKKQIENYAKLFKKFRIVLGPLEVVNHTAGLTANKLTSAAEELKQEGEEEGNKGKELLAWAAGSLATIAKASSPASKIVNLGDVPVSVKYFVEFLGDRMTKKDQASYPLAKFLNDFFKNLLTNFLNDDTCFDVNIKQKIRLNQAALTSYKKQSSVKDGKQMYWNHDEITRAIRDLMTAGAQDPKKPTENKPKDYYLDIDAVEKPVLNISGERKTPDGGNPGVFHETNYLTYFAGRTSPREKMNGDFEEDKEAGIFHYVLGKNRGIIKDIKLSKTDSKGLPEVRFEQDGYDGLKQLRVVYDVDVDTYLNVKTFPGSYIFVDPRGFAPNTNLEADSELNLTEYGIGGYCMIIRSTHEFGPGLAKSSLHAKWVHDTNNNLDKKADNERESHRGANDGDSCSSADVGHTRRKSEAATEKAEAEAKAATDDVGIIPRIAPGE
jgi:hypothetical protein